MYLKKIKFNHDVETLEDSIGMTSIGATVCRERILFTCFAAYFTGIELYGEDLESHPREFRTLTGDLQRCLAIITDPIEYEFTLLTFRNVHKVGLRAIAAYRDSLKKDENDLEDMIGKKLSEVFEAIMKQRHQEEQDDDDGNTKPIDNLNKETLIKRVSLAKKCNNDFTTYMSMLGRHFNDLDIANNAKPEINDLLSGIFKKNEDES